MVPRAAGEADGRTVACARGRDVASTGVVTADGVEVPPVSALVIPLEPSTAAIGLDTAADVTELVD